MLGTESAIPDAKKNPEIFIQVAAVSRVMDSMGLRRHQDEPKRSVIGSDLRVIKTEMRERDQSEDTDRHIVDTKQNQRQESDRVVEEDVEIVIAVLGEKIEVSLRVMN